MDYLEVLRTVTASAYKVYAALLYLGRSGKPFPATTSELVFLTGLSGPTVFYCVKELIERGVVCRDSDGEYVVPAGVVKFNAAIKTDYKKELSYPVGVPILSHRTARRLKVERGGGSGGRGDSKVTINGVTFEERRAVTDQAASILGSPRGKLRYTSDAQGKLAKLLREGFTISDALEAVRYCRAEYDRGDRFKMLLNLVYVWSATKFPALLTAARTTTEIKKEYSVIEDPVEREVWKQDYEQRLREKGLM